MKIARGSGRKHGAQSIEPGSAAGGKKKKIDGNPDWKTVSKDTNLVNTNADIQFIENSGPNRLAALPETPLQFLQLFFTDDIFEKISQQTNLYFDFVKNTSAKTLCIPDKSSYW